MQLRTKEIFSAFRVFIPSLLFYTIA